MLYEFSFPFQIYLKWQAYLVYEAIHLYSFR